MFRLETFVLGVVVLEEIIHGLAEEIVGFGEGVDADSIVVEAVGVEGGRATGG